MTVLVTGGTGFIGSHLVDNLLAERQRVRCLVRRPDRLRWLEGLDVEIVEGDVADRTALDSVVRGVRHVFHVAGLIQAPDAATYLRVNAEGTGRLAAACRAASPRPRRFVLVSSLAAAGPSPDGRPRREDEPCRPVSGYGRSKLAGEEALRSEAGGMSWTVVRPPAVYGPRDQGIHVFFQAVRAGIVPLIGHGKRVSLVHVRDLVRGIRLAAGSPTSIRRAYFVCNDETYSWEDVARGMGDVLGARARELRIPDRVARWVGVLGDHVGALRGKTVPWNGDKLTDLTQAAWVCSNARARKELGFHPGVSLIDGLRETADWYVGRGWLRKKA